MRENRIKFLNLNNAGSLTSDSDGNFGIFNPFNGGCNGEILKVNFQAGNHANGGSVGLIISGMGERIWTHTDADTSVQDYIHVYTKNEIGATGSPQSFMKRCITQGDVLYLWGSGCGDTTSGLALELYYR